MTALDFDEQNELIVAAAEADVLILDDDGPRFGEKTAQTAGEIVHGSDEGVRLAWSNGFGQRLA